MSEKKLPAGLLATDQPDLFFEDNTVGRLKKEVYEKSDAEIDALLAEYGVPSPVEWGSFCTLNPSFRSVLVSVSTLSFGMIIIGTPKM